MVRLYLLCFKIVKITDDAWIAETSNHGRCSFFECVICSWNNSFRFYFDTDETCVLIAEYGTQEKVSVINI